MGLPVRVRGLFAIRRYSWRVRFQKAQKFKTIIVKNAPYNNITILKAKPDGILQKLNTHCDAEAPLLNPTKVTI